MGAFNPYKIKKWVTLIFTALFPAMVFAILLFTTKGDMLVTLLGLVVSSLLFAFVAGRLIRHPFSQLVEGDGLLVFDLPSTGLIRPFIVKLNPPMIEGKYFGEKVDSVYSRNLTAYLRTPILANAFKKEILKEDGKTQVELSLTYEKEDERKVSFGFESFYPVMIYNSQLKTFLTKESLTAIEEKAFVENTVLNLRKKVEDLHSQVRDFARYVVEQTKPKSNFLSSPIAIVIIIVVIIIIIVALFPVAIKFLQDLGILEKAPSVLPGGTQIPGQLVTPNATPPIQTAPLPE